MKKAVENVGGDVATTNALELTKNYSGEIASLHNGYVFIKEVKSEEGKMIKTGGDVFCPVAESHNFFIGQSVNFYQIIPDKERKGKFRTEKIFPDETNLKVNTPGEIIITTMLLSKTISEYHRNKIKVFTPETVLKEAAKNMPFGDLIKEVVISQKKNYDQKDLNEMAKDFLGETFSILKECGLNCSVYEDRKTLKQIIVSGFIKKKNHFLFAIRYLFYIINGVIGQAKALKNEYYQFLRVRKVFNFMNNNKILNKTSVVNIKHLPELTFAMPVWYTYAKNKRDKETYSFFINHYPSKIRPLYESYNKNIRSFSKFDGREAIPVNIIKRMTAAKKIFDYVVIMTPYHDVAIDEMEKREILMDPVMVGFKKGMNHMFIIGRWSGTGIFPLLLDLIAATMKILGRYNILVRGKYAIESSYQEGKLFSE